MVRILLLRLAGGACSCYCCNLEGFVKWRLYMIIILFVVHLVDLADVNNNK